MGVSSLAEGRYNDAETATRAAYDGVSTLFGEMTSETLRAKSALCLSLVHCGKYDEHGHHLEKHDKCFIWRV